MQAIQIIQEEHRKLWRVATTLNIVADELDGGSPITPDFFTASFDYIETFVDQAHHPKEDGYLSESHKATKPDCEAPWADAPYVKPVVNMVALRMKASMRELMEL